MPAPALLVELEDGCSIPKASNTVLCLGGGRAERSDDVGEVSVTPIAASWERHREPSCCCCCSPFVVIAAPTSLPLPVLLTPQPRAPLPPVSFPPPPPTAGIALTGLGRVEEEKKEAGAASAASCSAGPLR